MYGQINNCILCGARADEGSPRCNDCEKLNEYIVSVYEDAKEQLSNNPSVDRETIFKIFREFAFVIQEDSLLKTYKNTINFFLQQFIDLSNNETSLELFMKKVPSRLNMLKILKELKDSHIVEWDPSLINSDISPKIFPGKVIINLKTSYNRTSIKERSEQRYGHAMAFYSILPLMRNYSQCNSKDEIKQLTLTPKKPWIILLAILIGNSGGRISLENTNRFLKKRRGIGNVYGTIVINLSSLSTDYTQKATVDIEENENNDREYLISPDIVQYLERIRENIRTR